MHNLATWLPCGTCRLYNNDLSVLQWPFLMWIHNMIGILRSLAPLLVSQARVWSARLHPC